MAAQGKDAKLGIIAGNGTMPMTVAQAAVAAGRPVYAVAIQGAARQGIEEYPHTWVNFGEIGRVLKLLKREGCEDIVIIGGVQRPKLDELRFDFGALRNLPAILRCLVGGDNSILSGVVEFFEKKGFRVIGAHDIAPELLAAAGPLGRHRPSRRDQTDIDIGIQVIQALGALDVGQAAVVAREHVLAVEAIEGTDALLERCGQLTHRTGGRRGARAGVLVKCAKPGQERRVDLPAIGPETVRRAAEAGLTGIALAAGEVLVAERSDVISQADRDGLFVVGVEVSAEVQ